MKDLRDMTRSEFILLLVTLTIVASFFFYFTKHEVKVYAHKPVPRAELEIKIDQLQKELDVKNQELNKYHADEAYIKSFGTDETTAKDIIKASEAMQVSPK